MGEAFVIASNNAHKVEEIRALLSTVGIELLTPSDVGLDWLNPEESGATFLENARIKSAAFLNASGKPALADDSGLSVDALGGAPGVFSARFSGEDASDAANNEKLLKLLNGISAPERTAKFVCTMVVSYPDGTEIVAAGELGGMIADAPRGKSGFGYDPLFVANEYKEKNLTLAEVGSEAKNKISHRARALEALMAQLPCTEKGKDQT
jgi:XTP/dITP diphosphohydrolase